MRRPDARRTPPGWLWFYVSGGFVENRREKWILPRHIAIFLKNTS